MVELRGYEEKGDKFLISLTSFVPKFLIDCRVEFKGKTTCLEKNIEYY